MASGGADPLLVKKIDIASKTSYEKLICCPLLPSTDELLALRDQEGAQSSQPLSSVLASSGSSSSIDVLPGTSLAIPHHINWCEPKFVVKPKCDLMVARTDSLH